MIMLRGTLHNRTTYTCYSCLAALSQKTTCPTVFRCFSTLTCSGEDRAPFSLKIAAPVHPRARPHEHKKSFQMKCPPDLGGVRQVTCGHRGFFHTHPAMFLYQAMRNHMKSLLMGPRKSGISSLHGQRYLLAHETHVRSSC